MDSTRQLNKFSWSEEDLLSYEAVIKREMDHQAILSKQYNDGLAEGEARGKLEKSKNIAKAMLEEAMDINMISKLTNLSIEEIEKL